MTVYQLVKRNFYIFIRDRSAVFFSLLSMLIVIMLMAVFLGSMNVDEVVALLKEYGGKRDALKDREQAQYLVNMWTIAGILVVNSVTVTLTAMGVMIKDSEENRLASFYIAPVKRIVIALGYILSSIIIGTVMCILTLVFAEIYVVAEGGALPGVWEHLKILGLIILNTFVFSFIMYLLALFIKSSSAWSGLATIVGTLVGFIGAIYLPMGELPEQVGSVLKFFPVLHGTALMRKLFTAQALETVFAGVNQQVAEEYMDFMGITIKIGNDTIKAQNQIIFLIFCGIMALIAAMLILRVRRENDR